ncbi:MAG: hypothetical protein ACI8TA_002970, partial [Cyclobacteriaceae bacterium]
GNEDVIRKYIQGQGELTLKFIQGSYVCSSSDTSGLCPGVVHLILNYFNYLKYV